MLTVALVAFLPLALPEGAVVTGVGGVDDSATTVTAFVVDGDVVTSRALGSLAHRPGCVPAGVVVDDHRLVLSVQDGSAREARLVVVDLDIDVDVDDETRAPRERTLEHELVPGQQPQVVVAGGDVAVIAVRELDPTPTGSTFDVVRVGLEGGVSVLASRHALWVTPVRGARTASDVRMLVKESDGSAHVDVVDGVDDGAFTPLHPLGKSVLHSPTQAGAQLVVEREEVPGRRAVVVDDHGRVLARGLPGMSPVVGGGRLAVGTGRKDGTLLVGALDDSAAGADVVPALRTEKLPRAGVARPQAVSSNDVVVWLDRGASLPGELWLVRRGRAPLLLSAPPPRVAVQVWGIVDTAKGAR